MSAIKIFPQIQFNGTDVMPVSVTYFDTDTARSNSVGVEVNILPKGTAAKMRTDVEDKIIDAVNNDNGTPGKAVVSDIWW